MNGQWTGRYSGTNAGLLVIDLDDLGTHYEGIVCAYDDSSLLPSTFASIRTVDKQGTFQGRVQLQPIDPRTGEPTSWSTIANLFLSDIVMPHWADIHLNYDADTLKVDWKTNIETSGFAEIKRTKADAPTDYKPLPEVTNWGQFKAYVSDVEHRRYIFRGQSRPLRLRTGFHRTGRANLARFLDQDIKALHRHLSLRTSHIFNLSIPDENGAFLNLAQHHGYPTPLLDWTFSPFVAAFFAYHKLKNADARTNTDSKVRILSSTKKHGEITFYN